MAETNNNDNSFPIFDASEYGFEEERDEKATTRIRSRSAPVVAAQVEGHEQATIRERRFSAPLIPSRFDIVTSVEETPEEDLETSGLGGPWVVLFKNNGEPGSTFYAAHDGSFLKRYRHEFKHFGKRPESKIIPKHEWNFHWRDRSTSAPLFPSRLRRVENVLPDWASMTAQSQRGGEVGESSSNPTTASDAGRPSSLYVPKGSFNWADDDDDESDDYVFDFVGATSRTTTSNDAKTSSASQSSTSEHSQANHEGSNQDDEVSTQHDEDSAHDDEDFTQKDEDSNQDSDDLYQVDEASTHGGEEPSEGDERSPRDDTPGCSNCATLLARNAALQAELITKDEEYDDLTDSFTRYGAETQQELENARSMKREIEEARSVNRSTNSFKRDIARLATKNTGLETENRKLKHFETENQHLKQHMMEQVTHIVQRVMAEQTQEVAKYRAHRDEFYGRMKAAETEATAAEARAQSESDKRLEVMIELHNKLEMDREREEMDQEIKDELIANEAELKQLRAENAEIKQERDQLKLDIENLDAKVARLEKLGASTRQSESPQKELAHEDAMGQSLCILEDMLAVVMRQQELQKKRRRVVLPTEEEERGHHARLVALGVYAC